MEETKNKKIGTTLYVIVLIAVFVMFATTAYAYYSKVLKNKDNDVVVKNFNMLLLFDKGNQINATNLKNGWQESREFTIENYSKDTIGKYKIVLEIITPLSNMIDEKFIYTLEGVSESKDTSNKVINVSETPVPVVTKELTTGMITPENTHKYKITFKLNNSNINYSKDSIFAVRIKIANDN